MLLGSVLSLCTSDNERVGDWKAPLGLHEGATQSAAPR